MSRKISGEVVLFSVISIVSATLVDAVFYLIGGLQEVLHVMVWGFLRMYTPMLAVIIVGGLSTVRKYFHFSGKVVLVYFLSPLIVYTVVSMYVAVSMFSGVFFLDQLKSMAENISLDFYTFMILTFINSYINGLTINTLYAIGEEVGWRGFLLDKLESMGLSLFKSVIVIGVIWGLWHSPAILLLGYNYPENRVLGVFLFTLFTISCTTPYILVRKMSSSIIPTASLHGSMNALWGITLLITNVPREIGGLGIIAITTWTIFSIAMYMIYRIRIKYD
ncbi:MAG: CPBP family intramembrane glutamic endopeptidase [Nitrososphaerota archaeon]